MGPTWEIQGTHVETIMRDPYGALWESCKTESRHRTWYTHDRPLEARSVFGDISRPDSRLHMAIS